MGKQADGGELALDRFRPYLLLLARLHLDVPHKAKLDASDLVQQTLSEGRLPDRKFAAGRPVTYRLLRPQAPRDRAFVLAAGPGEWYCRLFASLRPAPL